MRRQIINNFKAFGSKQTSKLNNFWSRANYQKPLGIATGLLFASYYKLFLNNTNTIVKNAENPAEEDQLPPDFKAPELEPFSDEKYRQAVENNQDVIIVMNLHENVNASMNEIKVLLYYLQESKAKSKKQFKFLVFHPKTKEELDAFEKTHNIHVNHDTIFLLKNKYSSELRPINIQTALYNFQVIFDHFQKIRKLSSKNAERFASALKNFPSNSLIVLAYIPKDAKDYDNLKARFADLKTDRSLGKARFKNIDFVMVRDPESAKKFNLDVKNEGQLFLLSKSTKINNYASTVTLNNTNLNVIPLTQSITSNKDKIIAELSILNKQFFIFEFPNFNQFATKYTLILKVDKNKIGKREYRSLIDTFKRLHHELRSEHKDLFKDLKILKSSDVIEDGNFKVLLIDNEGREKYFDIFDENRNTIDKELIELAKAKPRSYVYKMDAPDSSFTEQEVLEFIKAAMAGKYPEFYETSKDPAVQKYSTKIVRDNFEKEILANEKDHVLFYHSAHCHACKQYKPYYEKFALENLKDPNSNVQWNRMDSDHNKLDKLKGFHHTPVFMVLKKECKLQPFVYSSQHFTPDLLKNFVNVTISQQFIHKEIEKNIWKNSEANKKLLQSLQLEELK